jgi:hypothetical protein
LYDNISSNKKLRTFFRKKKINKQDFFLFKSMPNFNFAELIVDKERRFLMTLGQLLLLVLIVVVFWLVSKMKKHDQRIDKLEGKDDE